MDYIFSIDGEGGGEPLRVPVACSDNAQARLRAGVILKKYPIFERIVVSRDGAVLCTLEAGALREHTRASRRA